MTFPQSFLNELFCDIMHLCSKATVNFYLLQRCWDGTQSTWGVHGMGWNEVNFASLPTQTILRFKVMPSSCFCADKFYLCLVIPLVCPLSRQKSQPISSVSSGARAIIPTCAWQSPQPFPCALPSLICCQYFDYHSVPVAPLESDFPLGPDVEAPSEFCRISG